MSGESKAVVHQLLEKLAGSSPFGRRAAEIIKLRYGIPDGYPLTLEEVGRVMKVTRERVRQIEKKALVKLEELLLKEMYGRELEKEMARLPEGKVPRG